MALWTPADITTALWLDAADSSTLFDAVSGGSLVAADGAVARWEDKSGNARHVTQSSSGARPQRKASVLNSLDALLFDGNDFLETSFASFGTSYTFYAVTRATNFTSASGGIIAARSKTSIAPINPQVSYNSDLGSQFVVRSDDNSVNGVAISGLSDNTWYLFGGTRSGNDVTTYRDGIAGLTGSNTIGTATTTVTSVGCLFTGTSTATTFLNGNIAEIIAAPSSSSGDRQLVEGYLAHKWGLAGSLPSDHPYKNIPPGFVPIRRRRSRSGGGVL